MKARRRSVSSRPEVSRSRRRRKADYNRRIYLSRPRSRTSGTPRRACRLWRLPSWSCRFANFSDAPPRRRPYRGIDRPVRKTASNWKVKARVTAKRLHLLTIRPKYPPKLQGRAVKRTSPKVRSDNLLIITMYIYLLKYNATKFWWYYIIFI